MAASVSMPWGSVGDVLATLEVAPPYRLEHLSVDEVPDLVGRLRRWYPDIETGMESCHLDPAFYEREVQLVETPADDRGVLALIAHVTGSHEIAALLTLSKDPRARIVSSRLGVIAPEHRRGALGFLGPMLLEAFGCAMGAGLAYYFATLKSRHQQAIAERRGFQLVGIMPAHDIDTIAPGQARRVYEALYAKVLAPADQVQLPDREALTANTQRVWDTLFGSALLGSALLDGDAD